MTDDPNDPSSDSSDDASSPDEGPSSKDKNALEWGVTVAGGLIVLFVVGFFVYELVAGASGPADLRVSLGEPSRDSVAFAIPVEIRNEGQRVAVGALVEVCAGPTSCAEVTFEYVPYQSKATGTAFLDAPLAAAPEARVVSYRDP